MSLLCSWEWGSEHSLGKTLAGWDVNRHTTASNSTPSFGSTKTHKLPSSLRLEPRQSTHQQQDGEMRHSTCWLDEAFHPHPTRLGFDSGLQFLTPLSR